MLALEIVFSFSMLLSFLRYKTVYFVTMHLFSNAHCDFMIVWRGGGGGVISFSLAVPSILNKSFKTFFGDSYI